MRAPRSAGKALICLLWLFAGLLSAEVASRAFLSPPVALIAPDSRLGWRFLPKVRISGGPGGGPYLTTNSAGFRDREHFRERRGSPKHRILVLGDSYAAGTAVADGRNFPSLLEEDLRRAGVDAEVINASVPAWATDQELLYYRSEGRAYGPGLVLLAVVPNDIRESFGKGLFELEAGKLVERAGPTLSLRDRALWFLLNHSSLVQALGERFGFNDVFRLIRKRYRLSFPLGDRDCDDYDLLHDPPAAGLAPARELFARLVLELRDEVRADGGNLVLTVLPTKIEFTGPEPFQPLVTPGYVSAFVKGIAAREKIPFLDLYSMTPEPKKALRLFLGNEYHYNEDGHRFYAARMSDGLRAYLPSRR